MIGESHIPGAMNNISIATNQRGTSAKAKTVRGSKRHKEVKARSVHGHAKGPAPRGPMRTVGKAR